MHRERVLGKNGRLPFCIREGPSQWVGDIGHVYMGSVSGKGVKAWAPSSVKMSGHGDNIQAPLIGGVTQAPIPNEKGTNTVRKTWCEGL